MTTLADRSRASAGRIAARPLWWRLLREVLLLGALCLVYTLGRALAGRHVGSASGHATDVWRLERHLRLPDPWFRAVIVLTTGLALAGHAAYPLMPPRMRPDLGFGDTGVRFGQSGYGPDRADHGLVNQYAAMPSMHVGWAALFALTVILVARSRWRCLAVAYPLATLSVVVVTGNHYWLDGVVGVALLAVAVAVVPRSRPPDHVE